MKLRAHVVAMTGLIVGLCSFAPLIGQDSGNEEVRFGYVDVVIDAGAPLAAYQFEIVDPTGSAVLVGVEGGELPSFAAAPYYDPAALQQSRVIVGDFQLDEELQSGSQRVARLHYMVSGASVPDYSATLMVAAGLDGSAVPAQVRWTWGESK